MPKQKSNSGKNMSSDTETLADIKNKLLEEFNEASNTDDDCGIEIVDKDPLELAMEPENSQVQNLTVKLEVDEEDDDDEEEEEEIEKMEVEVEPQQILENRPRIVMRLASKNSKYNVVKPPREKKKYKKKPVQKKEVEKKPRRWKKNREVSLDGPFQCMYPSSSPEEGESCQRVFTTCCEYTVHCRDEHVKRRKAIRCEVCEKPLQHDNVLFPLTPYNCKSCGEGFPTYDDLTNHTDKFHVKQKPFQCMQCSKKFTKQVGLQQHMKSHSGIRPFPCSVCPKAFTQKSGLEQHMRIHTKVKPYWCVVCGKTFCQSVHLQQHMRTHTNVEPFKCKVCDKRFKQQSQLRNHIKVHDTEGVKEN